jgi:hypothetical protein
VIGEPKEPTSGVAGIAAGGAHDIVVNARFLPNGLVDTITHRPDQMSPQQWFDRLCTAVPQDAIRFESTAV